MTMFSPFLPLIPGGVPCNHSQKLLCQPLSGLAGWKNCDGSVFVVAGVCWFAATGRLCKSRVGPACQESVPGGGSAPPLTQRCSNSGFCSGWTATKCWDASSSANKMPLLAQFSFQLFFFQWCLRCQWLGCSPSHLPALSVCVCVLTHLSVAAHCLLSYDHFEGRNYVFLRPMGLWIKNRHFMPYSNISEKQ